MRNTAFLLFGLVLLLLQANSFRLLGPLEIPGLVPSLVLPLIVFMGVHDYSLARGAAVSFALGYITDLVGIAPVGLYTFSHVAIFVLARAASVRLAAQTLLMQVLLATVFAAIHAGIVLVLLAIFGRDAWVPRMLYPLAVPHVLVTGILAPLVFRLAARVHAATQTSIRAGAGGEAR
jgi:rod shape-determining protein MreD